MHANNSADLGLFGPFWAVLGRFGPFYVPILAKAFFQKQECLKKGHVYAPLTPVAPPENGKSFILETRMPQKGTCRTRSGRRLHPLKTANHLFCKQECPKKGHASAPLAPIAPPENGKTFSRKTRMPQKRTIAICQKCQ
jgi:hypothetical protein